ncbi:LytTR family DNA-binding domain-containing protein [Spirosoma sp.]|uniref:LytR/AlgR family response regulator transcription factor n=1 Tax=Spirosoma sp. TaxID=1899569 RepID=UPI0026310924|nr:LytTR family DNA-binding domain-containing protein [Spirosoma sp.]MCX6218995.1 LytTR family DNA-binding domain-containing protein [Spirosoma sp.]
MKPSQFLNHFVVRNLLGLTGLLLVHYLSDLYAIGERPGFAKLSPYLYLVLLYGWIVFHNRILFERQFLQGRKAVYFGWLFLLMTLGSFNLNFILLTQFNISRSLPYLVNFWVYTLTGLGVYVTYRFLGTHQKDGGRPVVLLPLASAETDYFSCMVGGDRQMIPHADIHYIESLENYLKVITKSKTYVTRLTMKEAEERLPKRQFVRISRSNIVNTMYVDRMEADTIWIGLKELSIGKVYKRYVADQFGGVRGDGSYS